jgi:hypothetical protein
LAFKNNPLSKEIFGNKVFQKHRTSQLKMKEILALAHSKAEDADYKQALIDEGFKQERIDELETLRAGLDEANLQQEGMKTSRPVISQDRVRNLNAVWDYLLTLNKASKVVFEEDYARQRLYLLYPERGSNTPANEALISGVVIDINTLMPIVGASVKVYAPNDPGNFIEVFTNENGYYEIAVPLPQATELNIEVNAENYLQEQQTEIFEPGEEYPDRNFSLTPQP